MIKFNFLRQNLSEDGRVIPSIQFKSQENGGKPVEVLRMEDIDTSVFAGTDKECLPWVQFFDNGYRVSTITDFDPASDEKMSHWNGCVMVDLDSKKYTGRFHDEFNSNFQTIVRELIWNLSTKYPENFYFGQVSASGNSLHMVFYFDVDKTAINFKKCARAASEIVVEEFMSGTFLKPETGYDIVNYPGVIDNCGEKIAQPMFITHHPIIFNPVYPTGVFDVDSVTWERTQEAMQVDLKHGSRKIEFKRWTDDYIKEWGHSDRLAVAKVLANYFLDDVESARKLYFELCPYIHERYKKYSVKKLQQMFDKQYVSTILYGVMREMSAGVSNGIYTTMSRSALKFCRYVFGIEYTAVNVFTRSDVDGIEYDKVYDLNPGEYLSAVFGDIVSSEKRCVHIEAGCGVGKTRALIEYVKANPDKRVCFITPMTSINRNNFDGMSQWVVVDSAHKKAYKTLDDGKRRSVCTTWNSFVHHGMEQKDFDLYVFDESHALYLYDYRTKDSLDVLNSIRYLYSQSKRIVLMTGTPSLDRNIISDTMKVKVNKTLFTNKCYIITYNNSYLGYIYKDVREWLGADESNMALIMYDYANEKMMEKFSVRGISVDKVYNKRFDDDVDSINSNHTLTGRLTLVSVYGQAGINIYAPDDHKVRLYIINPCALSVIQYANRIRNRECVESVKLFYKREDITSVVAPMQEPDFNDVLKRLEIINSTYSQNDTWLFKANLSLNSVYLNEGLNNQQIINKNVYDLFSRTCAVIKYESQMQILYNRLLDAYYDVTIQYNDEDTKDDFNARMSGKIASVIETGAVLKCLEEANGQIVFNSDLDKKVKKHMDVRTESAMQNIIDYLSNEYYTMDAVRRLDYRDAKMYIAEKYQQFLDVFKKKCDKQSVSKAHIRAWSEMCDLRMKLASSDIGDEEVGYFVKTFIDKEEMDQKAVMRFAAAHVALYTKNCYEDSKLKRMCEEVYVQMKRLVENLNDFSWFVRIGNVTEKVTGREEDEKVLSTTGMLENHLMSKFGRREKIKTVYCYNSLGALEMIFDNTKKAAEEFQVSEQSVRKWIKDGKLHLCGAKMLSFRRFTKESGD